ncbi:MAG: type II secretion system GspH family protein [Helicobacteraceae bacterium]|jgi:prepilin-type N-terminal cleavage/methylation domain-containing protein|nr:type II secretion system GspH family protein [Helicobacteraceae bacterium]
MRKAFSMIELVITIVLIGIVFAAIPGLLFRAVEADVASLEGEALYHAAAKMQEIVSQPHNSMLRDGRISNNIAYVIDYDRYGGSINLNPICDTAAQDETKGIARISAEIAAKASPPITLKRDAICFYSTIPELRPRDFAWVRPQQQGINDYHGWTQEDFSQGYTLEVSVKPIEDNRVAGSYAAMPDWRVWNDSSTSHSDFLLITVRAAYSDDNETIGVLHYVASNIGKR